uniref:Uncharacterized protein n=1 Tax=Onchocerca volvulus TaxID=6282 RepID=A0A8R1TUS5_ONCVO
MDENYYRSRFVHISSLRTATVLFYSSKGFSQNPSFEKYDWKRSVCSLTAQPVEIIVIRLVEILEISKI